MIKKHIDRKNIMIHLFPPTDDSFFWEHGWNGAVSQVDHDYLMVVDSSLPGHSTEGCRAFLGVQGKLISRLTGAAATPAPL